MIIVSLNVRHGEYSTLWTLHRRVNLICSDVGGVRCWARVSQFYHRPFRSSNKPEVDHSIRLSRELWELLKNFFLNKFTFTVIIKSKILIPIKTFCLFNRSRIFKYTNETIITKPNMRKIISMIDSRDMLKNFKSFFRYSSLLEPLHLLFLSFIMPVYYIFYLKSFFVIKYFIKFHYIFH